MVAEVAVTQAALLAGVLMTNRQRHRAANRLLAALVLTIGAMIGLAAVVQSPAVARLPHLIRLNHPLDFLLGPLLFLYVRARLGDGTLRRIDWIHFLPAALCVLYLLPYYFQSGADKLADRASPAYATWYLVRSALAISLCSVYVAVTIARVVRHVRRRRAGIGPVARVTAPVMVLCAGFFAATVVAIVRYWVDVSTPEAMAMTKGWLPLAGTIVLCGMAYVGLRDSGELAAEPALGRPRKYETSSLSDDRAERGRVALLHALRSDRAYLDPDLTLKSLAARVGMPASHVSQIINERLHQNFTDLINQYRVEEAKRRLLEPASQHYSIAAIAEEVGFRSKSSFNAVFKKHAHMTPSAFREQSRPDV